MGQCSGKLGSGGDRADILETTAWIRKVVTGYQDNRKQGQNMDNTSIKIKGFTMATWQAAVKISVYLPALSVCVCVSVFLITSCKIPSFSFVHDQLRQFLKTSKMKMYPKLKKTPNINLTLYQKDPKKEYEHKSEVKTTQELKTTSKMRMTAKVKTTIK